MNRKKSVLLLCILFITTHIYSLSLNQYEPIKIKKISIGNDEGDIGFKDVNAYAGGATGPTTFAISQENNIYIPDRINQRIVIYDSTMNYLKTIIGKNANNCSTALKMLIQKNNDIICLAGNKNLIKINDQGKLLFEIKKKESKINLFRIHDIYSFQNNILYYDQNFVPCIINEKGVILTREDSLNKIKATNLESTDFISYLEISSQDQRISKYKEILGLKKEFSQAIIGNKFLSNRLYEHIEYYKAVGKILSKEERVAIVQKKMQKQMKNNNIQLRALDNIDFNIFKEPYFIGFDDRDNSYWHAEIHDKDNISKQVVFIVSMFGDIIEVFQYGERRGEDLFLDHYPATGSFLALAPNGDIYFMRGSEKGYNFYKITRRW